MAHPGDLTKLTDPDLNAFNYTYDAYGDRSSATDPLTDKTTYFYDTISFGNRLTVTDPLSHKTTYHYDPNQNLDKITDPLNNLTTNVYDLDNELIQVKRADSPPGTSSWGFDSLHRMVSYTNSVAWAYNLRSRPTSITYPGALSVTEGYDTAGRWSSLKDWNLNQTSFTYDANSNLSKQTLPSSSGVVDTFTFDRADNLSAISDKQGAAASFSHPGRWIRRSPLPREAVTWTRTRRPPTPGG